MTFFNNNFVLQNKGYFNKAFIFDIDPLTFYQNDTRLKLLLEAMKVIAKYQNILFVGKCWMQLLDSIRELINPYGRINLVSGSGSCYFDFQTNQTRFFHFIDQELCDFIIHLATSTTNGVIVQGQTIDKETNKQVLKTASYFLNYLQAKEVRNKWKIKSELGFNYFKFKNLINEMKIAEIYFFGNDAADLKRHLIYTSEHKGIMNFPLDTSSIRCELVSEFEQNVFAFSANKNSTYAQILEFLKDKSIALENTYYVSINSYDQECIDNLPKLILPEELVSLTYKKPIFTYKKGETATIGSFWFENSELWRVTKI